MNFDKKKILSLLLIIFFLAILPLTLILVRQRQEIRKKATGLGYLIVDKTEVNHGDVLNILIRLPSSLNVGYVYGALDYDTDLWSRAEVTAPGVETSRVVFSSSSTTHGTVSFRVGAKNSSNPLTDVVSILLYPNSGASGEDTIELSGSYNNLVANPTNQILLDSVAITIVPTSSPTPTATTTATHTPAPTPTATPGFTCALCDVTSDGCFDSSDLPNLMACYSQPVAGSCAHWDVNFDERISILDYSKCGTLCSCSTPMPTATVTLPAAGGWEEFIPGGRDDPIYDLWPIEIRDHVVNGFDYVRWLYLGGSF